MIQIENLTPLQKELCDCLWRIESTEEVRAFIESMPKRLRLVAESMLELLIAATMDHEINSEDDCELAKKYLRRFCIN